MSRRRRAERHEKPPWKISDGELSSFAALYDKLGDDGCAWRISFVGKAVRLEVSLSLERSDFTVEADSIRECVSKLSAEMIAAAMKNAPTA